jgi:hypothetical protein
MGNIWESWGEDPSPYHNMALTQLMSFSVKKVTHII